MGDQVVKTNISIPASVERMFDGLYRSGRHGDKTLLIGLSLAILLSMDDKDRIAWMEKYNIAVTRSRFGGTVMEKWRELLEEQRVNTVPLGRIQVQAAANHELEDASSEEFRKAREEQKRRGKRAS